MLLKSAQKPVFIGDGVHPLSNGRTFMALRTCEKKWPQPGAGCLADALCHTFRAIFSQAPRLPETLKGREE